MADVKWIKIVTDIFDDEKMLLIESLPDADGIIVIWFKLLCLAGKQNNSGVFVMANGIPYTDQMLATIFRRKENTVKMALSVFEQFGMVEIVNDAYTIPNWGKHQDLDQLEKRKEYMRGYMQDYRNQQKALTGGKVNSKVNSKVNVNTLDKNREDKKEIREDIDIDTEGEILTAGNPPTAPRPRINYTEIQELYNSLCPSLPKCTILSDTRKKAIKARFASGRTIEDFKQLFIKAEQSTFLRGASGRDWQATFDWLLKDANMAKVLDGNYDNHGQRSNGTHDNAPGNGFQTSNPFLEMWNEERKQ